MLFCLFLGTFLKPIYLIGWAFYEGYKSRLFMMLWNQIYLLHENNMYYEVFALKKMLKSILTRFRFPSVINLHSSSNLAKTTTTNYWNSKHAKDIISAKVFFYSLTTYKKILFLSITDPSTNACKLSTWNLRSHVRVLATERFSATQLPWNSSVPSTKESRL